MLNDRIMKQRKIMFGVNITMDFIGQINWKK
jgi:hypothetical protein